MSVNGPSEMQPVRLVLQHKQDMRASSLGSRGPARFPTHNLLKDVMYRSGMSESLQLAHAGDCVSAR